MFQNRHQQGNSSQQQQMKLSIDEPLERVRSEFQVLQNQLQQARVELEKANQANQELTQRYYLSYQESMFGMWIENQKNMEIIKRLSNVITHIIPQVPHHSQEHLIQAVERAKTVTQQDLQMVAASMFPGMASAAAGISAASMMGPAAAAAFNPAMLGMAGLKPDEALQATAMFQNLMKNPATAAMFPPALLPSSTGPSTSNTAMPFVSLNDDSHGGRHSAAATVRASSSHNRPVSSSPNISKRAKVEVEEGEGELEIDVQNDDATSSAAPSHTNGRNSQPPHRGSSRTGSHHKDDRDSTHSAASSRDSPRSKRQLLKSSTPNSLAGFNLPPGAPPEMANILLMNSIRMNAMPQMNGKAAYAYKLSDGANAPTPVNFPFDASNGPGVIQNLKRLGELPHGDVVCAVTITKENRFVYTGGKGCVKVWDISRFNESSYSPGSDDSSTPSEKFYTFKLECLNDAYVRFCKLYHDNSMLLVGGESPNICIWDLNSQTIKNELTYETQACYALAISRDDRMCFSCCADGKIVVWDLVSETKVTALDGHAEGASCVDLGRGDHRLWTGGLDSTVRCWDIRQNNAEFSKFQLDSQVFSLGCCPTDDYIALGMENNNVEVLSTLSESTEKFLLQDHQSCVLSLKFAHTGKWFVSTGKDNYLTTWRTPYGYRLIKQKEVSSILSCDISLDDKFIITGSGDKKATVYEVVY